MSDTAPPTEQETKVLNSNPTTRPLGRVGAFAPGGYICKCIACGEVFGGDKRALNCLNCAIDALQAATPPSVDKAERALGEVIDQRDAAEEALSHAYYLVTGRSPEWSNLFGHTEALEEIEDSCALLRNAATPPSVRESVARLVEARERLSGLKLQVAQHTWNEIALVTEVISQAINQANYPEG